MKFEILKDGEAVEIRIAEDDGSFTIWVCDNEQTAVYKLAALLFSKPEDEKRLKRSILVGNFVPKPAEKKRTLEEVAKESSKRLSDGGLVRKEDATQPLIDSEQLKELLKQLTEQAKITIPLGGGFKPSIPNYPYPGYPMPYIGDPVPLGSAGLIPGWPNGGMMTVNYSSQAAPAEITLDSVGALMQFTNIPGDSFSMPSLNEKAVGCFKTMSGVTVNVYKASSMNISGNL